jgi:hypothetical protein
VVLAVFSYPVPFTIATATLVLPAAIRYEAFDSQAVQRSTARVASAERYQHPEKQEACA